MRKYHSVAEAEDMIPLLKTRIINLIKLSRAIEFLESIHNSARYKTAYLNLLEFSKCVQDLSDEELKNTYADYKSLNEKDRDMIEDVIYLLNLFEYLSIGIKEDVYDQKIIRQSAESIIKDVWNASKKLVIVRREKTGRDKIGKNLEDMVDGWN